MIQRTWRLAHILLFLFGLLSFQLAYWPVMRWLDLSPIAFDTGNPFSEEKGNIPNNLSDLPQPVVQRTLNALAEIERGAIYDSAGNSLAYNCPASSGVGETRCYADLTLAHVTGHVSSFGLNAVGPGVSGLEYSYNSDLLGINRFKNRIARTLHLPIRGNDIHLTINSDIQQATAAALGNRAGAVVVLDAYTGAVLAMVSYPTFDPNRINDQGYIANLVQQCGGALHCRDPFFNRATYGGYAPGSTWKTVIAAAAMETGLAAPDDIFYAGPPSPLHGGCFTYEINGEFIRDCNHNQSQISLFDSFVVSANVTFAQLSDLMPGEEMINYANRFGVGDRSAPPIEIGALTPQLANEPQKLLNDRFLRACTGIGQCQINVSPLNMALIAAAVANGGYLPSPYLVQEVHDPDGTILSTTSPRPWIRRSISQTTADHLKEMMIAVVEQGSGFNANPNVPELVVGGKTGTAETGTFAADAWFIGFVELAPDQAIAIAIVVDHGGEGSQVAAPIFAQVAKAANAYIKAEQ